MTPADLLAATIAAIAVAGGTLWLLMRVRDHLPHAAPNPRSLHGAPVPRVGGLAIWAGALPVALVAPPGIPGNWSIGLISVVIVGVISLQDDWRGVSPARRVAVHIGAAIALAAAILSATLHPASDYLVLLLCGIATIVWGANLYNFMDGSDGLAALMAVVGFTAYAIAALIDGASATAYVAIAAATVPLLWINWPPAKMFLGDIGAVPLGFLASGFGFAGVVDGAWPAWFPLIVFLPFIADATVTLLRRLLRGERVWEAHNTHYYQRLHRMGAGHRGTLGVYAAWMIGTAGSAVLCLAYAPGVGWLALAAWSGAGALLFLATDYHWRHHATKAQ
ncbi:MAG: glycosyl transferase [Casimicrobiaceae bacterium]